MPLNEKRKIVAVILSFKMTKVEHFKNENKEKKDIRKYIEKRLVLRKIHQA
jgi:hypothetical protein